MEVGVCPTNLLHILRRSLAIPPLPEVNSPAKARLIHLQAILVDPAKVFLSLLGHFTSAQIDRIEDPFQIAGEPVPWTSVISPLRAKLLLSVEVAWYGLETSVAPVSPSFRALATYSLRHANGSLQCPLVRFCHRNRPLALACLTDWVDPNAGDCGRAHSASPAEYLGEEGILSMRHGISSGTHYLHPRWSWSGPLIT